ncbi:MAG TPA: hypothetical protein VNB22_18190, partial [Pyrinomonadaceae bacterium]|nr:hypothetical protein [Pyrinomonadaceae bacterium]
IMSKNDQNIIEQIKAGSLNQSELQAMFSDSLAAANAVNVTDWGVCYNSATGQLSEYATVTAINPGNPITGIGMIAYTNDGSSMLCVQYTNDFNSPSIATSIGTTLYTPSMGNQVLCIIYGWTQQSSYYFSQTLTVGSC